MRRTVPALPGFGEPGGLHHPMTMTLDPAGLAWHDQIRARAYQRDLARHYLTVYRP